MTPEAKRIVQDTWRQVVPIADVAAELFYNRLFETDLATQRLFGKTDMPGQRKKPMHVIGVAVQALDNLEALVPTVEELGRRHARYGVADAHYDAVGAALLWTLERGLGPAWSQAAAGVGRVVWAARRTHARGCSNLTARIPRGMIRKDDANLRILHQELSNSSR